MKEDILSANRYLGTLCKNKHDFNGSGLSIRYKNKGIEKGGVCVVCNSEHCRKRSKKKKIIRNVDCKIDAICPMCLRKHMTIIKGGWFGNGVPRIYCHNCEDKKKLLSIGAVDYGYTN